MATLSGTPSGDTLFGDPTADTIFGGAGDDLLLGDDGDDIVFGGQTNDFLFGGPGADTLLGKAGIDVLEGDDGEDMLKGGGGDDSLFGGAGNDQAFGGNGNDFYEDGPGDDTVFGEDGDDFLRGTSGAGDNQYYGGAGADIIESGAGDDRLSGDGGNDVLIDQEGRNALFGGDGSDSLVGNGTVAGGNGDDFVSTGFAPGGSILTGGRGYDLCEPTPGGAVRIDYNALADAPPTLAAGHSAFETLFRFDGSAGHRIDLATIDASSMLPGNQTFVFVGSAKVDRAGEIGLMNTDGNLFIVAETNGGPGFDMRILVAEPAQALVAADFIL